MGHASGSGVIYDVNIARDQHRVTTTWGSEVTDAALMNYQRSVWRDPTLQGFDELIDFRALKNIEVTTEGLAAVASVAASMDSQFGQSRFAILVGDSLAFGLSRMYEAFREMNTNASRLVMVFDDLEKAQAWLDESRSS